MYDLDERPLTEAQPSESYVAAVQMVHSLTNFNGLAALVPPEALLYHAHRPGGPVVLAVRNEGLPEPYRQGIYGFRLAQYLRLRFADAQIAYRRSMIAEPHDGHGREVHVFALEPETGAILRYISLQGSRDSRPMSPVDPHRSPFPCETAHGVNLFEHILFDSALDTSHIWEVKRLVQRGEEGGRSAEGRLRLTLELMLGFYSALERIDPEVRMLVGDGEEGIAIRRMQRSLRDITVLEGTTPSLPPDDLMFPLYTQREVVKPFVAQAPRGGDLHRLIDRLESGLGGGNPMDAIRGLMESADSQIRRVRV